MKKIFSWTPTKVCMISLLLFVAFVLPNNLYAADSTSPGGMGALSGAFWMGLLCFYRRKQPIGGL